MTTTHTAEDMELLFGRVVNRVAIDLCPVKIDAETPYGGYCAGDSVTLNPKHGMPYRLYALLHEAAHYLMHVGPGIPEKSPAEIWEFEANLVASILLQRFEVPMLPFVDYRYHPDDVMALYPPDYFQRRVESAVERIWKIVGE